MKPFVYEFLVNLANYKEERIFLCNETGELHKKYKNK
jgi:hypothetical protein